MIAVDKASMARRRRHQHQQPRCDEIKRAYLSSRVRFYSSLPSIFAISPRAVSHQEGAVGRVLQRLLHLLPGEARAEPRLLRQRQVLDAAADLGDGNGGDDEEDEGDDDDDDIIGK